MKVIFAVNDSQDIWTHIKDVPPHVQFFPGVEIALTVAGSHLIFTVKALTYLPDWQTVVGVEPKTTKDVFIGYARKDEYWNKH